MDNFQEFDLNKNTNELLSEFDNINFTNSVEIIEWFKKAYDYNNIFESVEMSTHIYEELKKHGYKDVKGGMEELECINAIIKKFFEGPDVNGHRIISLIMKKLLKHERIDNPLKYYIDFFNERYNSKKTYSDMMHRMLNFINTEVVCMYVEDGQTNLKTGVLDRVVEYKSVEIEGETIPFIGHKTAINKIESVSGVLLYNNGRINSGYNLDDFSEIEKLREDTFGTEVRKDKKYL